MYIALCVYFERKGDTVESLTTKNKKHRSVLVILAQIATIIFAIGACVTLFFNWFEFSGLSLGKVIANGGKYSLFNISKLMDEIIEFMHDTSFYIKWDNVRAELMTISQILFLCGIIIILFNIIVMVVAAFKTAATKYVAGFLAVINILFAIAFVVAVEYLDMRLNSEFKSILKEIDMLPENGVNIVMKSTMYPYLFMVSSLMTVICSLPIRKKARIKAVKASAVADAGVQMNQPNFKTCKKCGAQLNNGDAFCIQCGAGVAPQTVNENKVKHCSNCGVEISANESFCAVCGNKLN